MKKRVFVTGILLGTVLFSFAQKKPQVDAKEVERIERTLASDEMEGRRPFTKGIDMAAAFIAAEFKKAGLKPVAQDSYFQVFNVQRDKFISASGVLDGKSVDPSAIAVFTKDPEFKATQADNYERVTITATDTLFRSVRRYMNSGKNYFVLVDTVHSKQFKNLKRPTREGMGFKNSTIFVLGSAMPTSFEILYNQEVELQPLKNVVGILPGKSKQEEQVIFSGHYDH
ncbi:MAG TPA: hypothetical protein VLC28_16775, partial [Flavitalea sp.]|nr:hypothetical protein [Flavitalea sp.]